MFRSQGRRDRKITPKIVCTVVSCSLVLVACSSPKNVNSVPVKTPSVSQSSADPNAVYDPNASVTDTQHFFDLTNQKLIRSEKKITGRLIIDNLVHAGFDKKLMQVTADKTSIDLDTDSLQFSVQFHKKCLIGQYGSGTGGYHSTQAQLLGTGKCLVGATSPIDW